MRLPHGASAEIAEGGVGRAADGLVRVVARRSATHATRAAGAFRAALALAGVPTWVTTRIGSAAHPAPPIPSARYLRDSLT